MFKSIITASLLSLVSMGSANAVSVSFSYTAPAGYEAYNFTPYIGDNDFALPGVGQFVGNGTVYAPGKNGGWGSDTDAFMTARNDGGQTLRFTTPQTSLVLEIFSMNHWNTITAGSYILFGNQIAAALNSPLPALRPIYVDLTDLSPFDAATFNAKVRGFQFEIGHIEGGSPVTPAMGTPEPSTWVMMLIGFACLGFSAFRQRLATVSQWRRA